MSTVINLYAGPGAGKSTTAALLFALMKQAGMNVELVREYVKDWAWEGRQPGGFDQFYFLGKQIRKESMLFGKVDYIITDCPVLMSPFYAMEYATPTIQAGVQAATLRYREATVAAGHKITEIWVPREKPYNPNGRYQTEEQARELDYKIKRFLWGVGVSPLEMSPTEIMQSLKPDTYIQNRAESISRPEPLYGPATIPLRAYGET